MKKIILGVLIGIVVLGVAGVVVGKIIPANEKAGENSEAINKEAGDSVLMPPGLQKIVYIHYKKGFGRVCDYDGLCEPKDGENPSCADCKKDEQDPEDPVSTCYAFLGAKWKDLPVNYVVHPELEAIVPGAIFASAETWDVAIPQELFSDSYNLDETASWDSDAPDGRNELLFGDYPQEGVIAVTIIWGYFRGRPDNRRITEFDILFDTDFAWGDASADSELMDLQNIAVHEIGHGVGLADIYDGSCGEVTMYGYSTEGETKKRSLEQADIVGLQSLYGN